MSLADILKKKIEEKILDNPHFLWIVDPLSVAPSYIKNLFPKLHIHIYTNPIDFRLFYEPLRARMEENQPAEAIVISSCEEEIPPDVRRYSPNPLFIKPSLLFPALHPIVDDIIVDGKLLERFAYSADQHKRGYQETIEFVLHTLLEVPFHSHPSLSDAFNILMAYHRRGEKIPFKFISPYLKDLIEIGYSEEELAKREGLIFILQQLLLASLERESGVDLNADERARALFPYIELEHNELIKEASASINWREVVDKIPIKPLHSLLLPADFYNYYSEKLLARLLRNRRDKEALDASRFLRDKGKASEKLEIVLECISSLEESCSLENWLSVARELALQWRSFKELPPDSELFREWERRRQVINSHFVDFILKNYLNWGKKPRPTLSCDVLDEAVRPYLRKELPVYLLVIDGMTYSQWAIMEDRIRKEMKGYDFQDKGCFSILPSATTYSRNSIFGGRFPYSIADRYGGSTLENNENEEKLLRDWVLERVGKKSVIYCKRKEEWRRALEERADLKAFILNFADELTHLTGRVVESEVELLRFVDMKYDFLPLGELFSAVKRDSAVLVITSDHGSIWVERTVRVPQEMHEEAGGKNTRYYASPKFYELRERDILLIKKEEARNWGLPDDTNYYIAFGNFMFLRQRVESRAVHGGISLWEMCVPLVIFTPHI